MSGSYLNAAHAPISSWHSQEHNSSVAFFALRLPGVQAPNFDGISKYILVQGNAGQVFLLYKLTLYTIFRIK